jgi:acyl-CoA dehydrogenase
MTENAADRGRQKLLDWQRSRPRNFFQADTNLQEILRLRLGEDRYNKRLAEFHSFGESCATVIGDALFEMHRSGQSPRLRRYDGLGQNIEQVEFHPNYHGIGQALYQTRVLSDYEDPDQEAGQLVFAYLFTQNGEAGHACPLACAAGMIKILQAAGSRELQARFLPSLLNPDYNSNFQASQFLTEIQGGSDVGANAVEARDQGDGSYKIYGEKWFCSVANADAFLMTARPSSAPEGTQGLGAFIVPRLTEDGRPNGFRMRRLKDKLGTRAMASSEMDFDGARAWPIGPVDRGFKNIVEIVLTTSRLYNAVSCAGIMRRAEIEAFGFAHARTAFGQAIVRFPLIQRSLSRIKCESAAAISATMALLEMAECRARGELLDYEEQFYRAAVPLNKMLTALRGTQLVHEAMEVLGGNGAIESFSVLPRLYRDSYILEAWEGTHNVLSAQILRDCAKYKIHEGLLFWCEKKLDHSCADESVLESTKILKAALGNLIKPGFEQVLQGIDSPTVSLRMRDLCELTMVFIQGITMLEEAIFMAGESDLGPGIKSQKAMILAYFLQDHGLGLAFDDQRLAQSIEALSTL